jgi:hypothetical protein
MVAVIRITSSEMLKDALAPKIMRLRISRPRGSVPRKWAELPPAVKTGGVSR